ncbi:MAG: hypothetical protein IT521_10435 [Burkholderiales bacterium]|nr:hypothetical protein [Burkholderiales bacterium]
MSDRSMFYRIVLQGRSSGAQDLVAVQAEFARVTGLPMDVTESLFAQTPRPIKERLAQADAERIAATLRAIGAAVTVERDLLASLDSLDNGVHELVAPDHRGPPTIVPGSEPGPASTQITAAQRLRKRFGRHLPLAVGAPLAIALLVPLASMVEDAVSSFRPARAVAPAASKPALADAPAPVARPNASTLHGPWRCTNQNNGLSVYWDFGADGALAFYGDTYKGNAPHAADPAIPNGWQLNDEHLVFTFVRGNPVAYAVSEFNLTRLRYGDGRDVDIQCRRP